MRVPFPRPPHSQLPRRPAHIWPYSSLPLGPLIWMPALLFFLLSARCHTRRLFWGGGTPRPQVAAAGWCQGVKCPRWRPGRRGSWNIMVVFVFQHLLFRSVAVFHTHKKCDKEVCLDQSGGASHSWTFIGGVVLPLVLEELTARSTWQTGCNRERDGRCVQVRHSAHWGRAGPLRKLQGEEKISVFVCNYI